MLLILGILFLIVVFMDFEKPLKFFGFPFWLVMVFDENSTWEELIVLYNNVVQSVWEDATHGPLRRPIFPPSISVKLKMHFI